MADGFVVIQSTIYAVAVDRVCHVCSAGGIVCVRDLEVILGPFTRRQICPLFPQAPAAHLPRSGVILEKTWGGANEQRAESVAEGSRPANCITVARRSEKGNIRPAIRPRDR